MVFRRFTVVAVVVAAGLGMSASLMGRAQSDDEKHGRKYKAPLKTSHLEILVVKDATGKPIPNASVIFHPLVDGENAGNMETKTGPDGKTTIDILPTGSVVSLQVIATGFATHGSMFTLSKDSQQLTVRMLLPQQQVTTYEDPSGKGLSRGVGVREPIAHAAPEQRKTLSASAPIIKLSNAAEAGATVSGRVTNADGAPISQALVKIQKVGDSSAVTVVKATDDGQYAAVGLKPGTYLIHIEASGFEDSDHNNVELAAGASSVVNSTLAPYRKKK